MASLTRTAIITRKIIRYSIFAIIFLIVGRLLLSTGINVYRYFFPEPPPPPTVTFGKLPELSFPEGQTVENASYTLELPEGTLPTFPTQAKVYFMPKVASNLLDLESAIETARGLGFSPNPQEISDTVYRFSHSSVPATLEINIVTGIFSVSYSLSQDSSPIERIPPAPEVAASTVRSFLSSGDLLPEDLTGPTTSEFLSVEGGNLVLKQGRADSHLTKVNLYRKAYDEHASLPPDPDEANVWFMVSGSNERAKRIIAGEFHYFPVDESQSSTYPIKTAQQAFDELQAGNAYIIRAPSENITIRSVYLAYYDSGKPAEFFQPIIVFQGDSFIAYVPAVTAEYYGE